MTYTAGSLIVATDYNGFVSTNGANVNGIWSTGAATAGYGETALSTVSTGATISATEWSTLNSKVSAMASHQGTTITSRTNPVVGDTIAILANMNTDITNITSARGNAAASGAQTTTFSGTTSKTSNTGSGSTAWTITFTHTITWASANAARYFFNAGGRIKWETSKTSTGNLADAEWNDLANTLCGDIYISGLATSHTIAGTPYTGTTKIGGTGTPTTLSTGTGFDALVAGAGGTIVYKQFADTAPYTSNFIQHTIAKGASSDTLVITTLWSASDGDPISGGTAPSGATPGTAPCTIVTYYPPETTYLTSSWGTPTVAATTV